MKNLIYWLKKGTECVREGSEKGSGFARFDSHSILSHQSVFAILCMLFLGIGQVWANNYIEGDAGLITTGWSKTGYRIDNTPYNNYAVAGGKYNFKITDGNTESGGSCFGTVTGVTSSNYGVTDGCMWINLTGINDVNITWANSGWNVNITVTPSSYFIKYPWGDNHAWTFSSPMTACSDGTYACTGPYNGTTYDFGRRGYDGGAGALTSQTATVNNTPSTDEKCVFSVTTAGALTITRCNKVTATNKIYFDNSKSNFSGKIFLVIGHDKPTKYSKTYELTQLTGTKLYYASVGDAWTDATYYAIIANSSSVGEGSWGSDELSTKGGNGYTAVYTGKYDLDGSNKQYLFTTASSGNGQELTITYKNTDYSNLNYTQTVTLCTKAYGAGSYSANTSSLTSLNFTTYNLTAVGTVSTQQTNNMNGSTGVASGTACQAAPTVIHVGDAPAGWVYDGIFESMTGAGSAVSEDQEFTYYPREATNYYARFHEVHDPSVSLAASSSYLTTTSGLRALKGEVITLTATAVYNVNSLVYTYEYSTNGGSTWNTIASRSTSGTQTYTASSTGDYIFRVTLPDEAGTVNSTTNVHMTQMYTINVKKNASWTPNKLYIWNKSSEITQHGAFPGATGKFTNKGQWYSFELNSDFDSFVISASDHSSNHTVDVNNVSADGCYTIGGTTGTSCSVSSGATCPSAPSVTTGAATSLTNTSATFNATGVSANNDPITAYGFKWGTTDACANTQTASNLSSTTFSFNKTSLTAGTTIYFKAYATNGQGTTYGTVQSFVVPYSVEVQKPTGCSSITPSAGNYYYSTGFTVTADAATGYTFSSWSATNGTTSSASSPSTGRNTVTFTPSANSAVIKPTYTENKSTITINTPNASKGSLSTTGDKSLGVATSQTVTANAAIGYKFDHWEKTGVAVLSSTTANPVTITTDGTASSTGTVTAVFVPRFELNGSQGEGSSAGQGMPGWDTGEDFDDITVTSISDMELKYEATLYPNRQYRFMVYDKTNGIRRGCTSSTNTNDAQVLPAEDDDVHDKHKNWQLNGEYNVRINTVGYGSYTFKITALSNDANNYPSLEVERQESYLLTLGRKVYYNEGASNEDASDTNGGTVTAKTNEGYGVVDGDGFAISNGQYFATGSDIVFTATPASGYSFAGWYSDAECTSDYVDNSSTIVIDDEAKTLTLSNIEDNVSVYAKFTENMHELKLANDGHGHVEISSTEQSTVKVGVVTTATITAVPDAGYYFTSWTIDDGVTDGSGNAVSTTANPITVKTTSDGKQVQANFHADEKLYFDNSYTQWSEVWVYLFNNNCWYNNKSGDFGPGVAPKVNRVAYAQMTKVPGEENLYEYAYHSSAHDYSFDRVAFCAADQHNNGAFYQTHAAYRSDWCATLPVYVATAGYDSPETNQTKYHNGGYWRAYNPKAGDNVYYYLDVFTGTHTPNQSAFEFKASGDGALVAETSVRLTTASSNYTIGVHSSACSADQHYAMGTTITINNSDDILKLYKYDRDWNITLTTSSEGIYTFVLSQEYDSLRLSVIYPASVGDYRLTYSYGSPAKTRSSDIMKKKATDAGAVHTSMYVDPTDTYSQLIVQRCCTIISGIPQWEDRKTFNHANVASLFNSKGVYEMDVTIAGTNGDASTLTNIAAYNGPFYIKTDCAPGGWADYTKNEMEQNTINFNASKTETFDYYFVKYVAEARKKYGTNSWDACNLFTNASTPTNIKCVIANQWNNSISDTLKSDDIIKDGSTLHETLPKPGSIRFSYNSATNELKRAYLNGSSCREEGFLLLEADQDITTWDDVAIADNKTTFTDNNNWIYILTIKAPEGTRERLTAKFDSKIQYLKGSEGVLGESTTEPLIGGSDDKKIEKLRLIYDFKTNHLMSAWVPGESAIDDPIAIYADVIIIRNHQGEAQQIRFTEDGALSQVKTVYGVMEFEKETLLNDGKTASERSLFWISFPFDVNLNDAFGLGTYGTHWIIEYYDGAERASQGYWADSKGFWKFVTPAMRESGYTLKKNVGYVLALDLDELYWNSAEDHSTVWDNSVSTTYIYFPSASNVGDISATTAHTTVDSHPCTIDRRTDTSTPDINKDRTKADAHWNVIGVPSYANYDEELTSDGSSVITWKDPETQDLPYLYEWDAEDNSYTPQSGSTYEFKAMHAYMVQYHGNLYWSLASATPPSVAARHTDAPQNVEFRLELQQDDAMIDQTFVKLSDEENVSANFAFDEDLCKEYNARKANIYTFIENYIPAAGNCLPTSTQTTIIPVGVKVVANGDYTFSMPDGTSGMNVTLVDTYTGARTSLGLIDYTTYLTTGTHDGRFLLEIAPVQNAPTEIENAANANANANADVRKVLIDGRLYIVKDGKAYDATGQMVK